MCPLYASDVISNVSSSASNFRRNSTFVPISELRYWGDYSHVDVVEARTYYATEITKAISLRAAIIANTRLTRETVDRKLFELYVQEERYRSKLNILLGKPFSFQPIERLVKQDLLKWAANVEKAQASRVAARLARTIATMVSKITKILENSRNKGPR